MKRPLDFDQRRGIDLHIHSNASDGTDPPTKIIQTAERLGLKAIAITDHDTLEGSRQALISGIPKHIHFLTGVEISTQAPAGININGSLHILGYDIDLDNTALQNALNELKAARNRRTPMIVEQLQREGISITLAQIQAEVGQGTPGRPHIASVLVKTGVTATVNEAFDTYLAKGRPGYVDKYRIDCRQAIALIRASGGIAVLAHPYLIAADQLAPLLDLLSASGLEGIEAYYAEHSSEDTKRYLELARQYDLWITGGSDYHGDIMPDIHMGSGRGNLFVPYDLYEAILARRPSH